MKKVEFIFIYLAAGPIEHIKLSFPFTPGHSVTQEQTGRGVGRIIKLRLKLSFEQPTVI